MNRDYFKFHNLEYDVTNCQCPREYTSKGINRICASSATHILYEKLLELYGTDPDRAKDFEPVPLICKVKRESPATKAQKERLTKLLALHQLTPDYDVSMLTKNEASRQIDRILAAYGSLQK